MSLLDAPEALAVAREVALRLLDPECVRQAAQSATRQSAYPDLARWEPSSLAQGDAGLALMCAAFDHALPGEDWDTAGHRLLAAASADTMGLEARPATSVFSGLAGIAFAATQLSHGRQRYLRLLAQLEAAILPEVDEAARDLAAAPDGVAVQTFDAISGLAGTCAYLLGRVEEPPVARTLQRVLTALVALTAAGPGVPRWHTPHHLIMGDSVAARYPDGCLNCGLAHGVPGPLAAMAIALLEGQDVAGLSEAVARTADWLARHRVEDQWGPNWPYVVPTVSVTAGPQPLSRDAWCYGTPGVARSLWLAGRALGDPALSSLATDAMLAVHHRQTAKADLDSPTFCHGAAGLTQIMLRFAADTGLNVFRAGVRTLVDRLLADFDPTSPLGYAATEPGNRRVDNPGLIDGAAGVAMVLLSVSTDAEPTWDRVFLLS